MEAYCINKNASLLDALKVLNSIEGRDSLTLFVVDENFKVVGTLTDGDIRRSIINGKGLEDKVSEAAFCSFSYLRAGNFDVRELHKFRIKGVELIPVLDDSMHLVDTINLKKTKTILPIDAVLMAGGKGERLRPLTEKVPKPLLKIGPKSIIDYNVDRLIKYGIKNIDITVNYLGEQLVKHFRMPRHGVQVKCYKEPEFRGTMGSINLITDFHSDIILIMNADLFTNIDFEEFFLHFRKYDADLSIAAVPYTVSIPFGICDLDGWNVKGIVEKPTYNYYANAGIYLMKREVLKYIPGDRCYHATDLIADLIAADKKVIRYPLNGTWIDIGNKEDYQKAIDLANHLTDF